MSLGEQQGRAGLQMENDPATTEVRRDRSGCSTKCLSSTDTVLVASHGARLDWAMGEYAARRRDCGRRGAQTLKPRCRRLQSSKLMLAISGFSCSDYLTMGRASCSHYLPLCSPSSGRARQRMIVPTLVANERICPVHTGTPATRSCSMNSRVRSAARVPARRGGVDALGQPGPERLARQVRRHPDMFGDPTLADAILDRLVHTAHRIELKGGTRRKPQAIE